MSIDVHCTKLELQFVTFHLSLSLVEIPFSLFFFFFRHTFFDLRSRNIVDDAIFVAA